MTKEQFNEIKERLAKWREERHLTYENQRAGFLGNVFEEVSEYYRAQDDYDRVDSICDICILCFNALIIDYDFFIKNSSKVYNPKMHDIVDAISLFDYKQDIKSNTVSTPMVFIVSRCASLCKNLGFDFYKCMIETIKEIESRSGYYDTKINKFIKDDGAYTKEEVEILYKKDNIDVEELDDEFLVCNKEHGEILNGYVKWYKANYENCKL